MEAGFIWSDLLTDLERTSDHCSNIPLASGALFILSGMLPAGQIIGALDFNVLLMIGGTMGLVQLFIDNIPYVATMIPVIAGIGILRKEGYDVKNADFFKIGIPFTLSAIVPAYILIWILFGGM